MRKLARLLARFFAGTLLLLVLALAGLLLWLRTDAAARFVARQAVGALEEQGLFLNAQAFHGPLPGHISVTGLELADADGLFLKTGEAALHIKLASLLRLTLEVEELRVTGAELFRLPAPPREEEPETAGGGMPALPLDIVLASLRIENAVLHQDAFAPFPQTAPQTGREERTSPPRTLTLNTQGSAFLISNSLGASLESSVDYGGTQVAALTLLLSSGLHEASPASPGRAAAEDNLELTLTAFEDAPGLGALLLGMPELPAYKLSLQGKGPVSAWGGALDFSLQPGSAFPPVPDSNKPLALSSTLSLSCRSGSLWRDFLNPDFSFQWQTALDPGAYGASAPLDALGGAATLALGLEADDTAFKAKADFSSPLLAAVLDNIRFALAEEGKGQSLQADARILAAGLFGGGALSSQPFSAEDALPDGAVRLRARLDGSLQDGESVLSVSGNASVKAVQETLHTDFSLQAQQRGQTLLVNELLLSGMGLEARASARLDTAGASFEADASLTAQDHAPWQNFAAEVAGIQSAHGASPSLPVGGAVTLDAAMRFAKTPSPSPPAGGERSPASASGEIRLQAKDMRWPDPRLEAICGPNIDMLAQLSGGEGLPYVLDIPTLSAGILSASGKARFTPEQKNTPDAPLPGGTLAARFEARVSDLAPLAGTPGSGERPSFSGPLAVVIDASGPLDALSLTLTANSERVQTVSGDLRGLAFALQADTAVRGEGFSTEGKSDFSLASSPGGPVALSSRWSASRDAGSGELQARLDAFSLNGAGIKAEANLAALVPARDPAAAEEPNLPLISGSAVISVEDWTRLAALSGTAIRGTSARFSLDLRHDGGRQNASFKAGLPSLSVKEPDAAEPFFSIRDLAAEADASDIFGPLNAKGRLTLGQGGAGPLRWKSGQSALDSVNGKGTFSLELSRATAERARNPRSQVLALGGSFDLPAQAYVLEQFRMAGAVRDSGLDLQQPVRVNTAEGLDVSGLDIAFKPSGRFTAQAAFSETAFNLQAALEKLPFSALKLFTGAPLPGGDLEARVSLSGTATAPQGNFSLDARFSGTGSAIAVSEKQDGGAATNPTAAPGGADDLAVHVEGAISNSGGLQFRGGGTLGSANKEDAAKEGRLSFQIPLLASANGPPLPASSAPMAAALRWEGPIAPLWQAVPLPDRHLTGQALFDLAVTGSMDAPKALVSAYIAKGRYQDIPGGLLIQGIDLEARTEANGTVIALLAAEDASSGSLSLEARLEELLGNAPAIKLRGQLDAFKPLHRDDCKVALSGIFGVNGPLDRAAVTGTIVVDQGELSLSGGMGGGVPLLETSVKSDFDDDVPASFAGQSAAAAAEGETGAVSGPALDMRIMLPHSFHIRGLGLESEWQGDLRITGAATSPSVTGSLQPVRGYMDILSRSFEFTGGDIHFFGGSSLIPSLSLELAHESAAITAFIRISGTAKKPKLELTSRPPLPQDEVLAHVLFGKRTSELSRFEAIQLANSMRELTGFGGSALDLLGGTRKKFGLDMLRLGSSQGGDQRVSSGMAAEKNLTGPSSGQGEGGDTALPTLEAGKYINDSIYIGVEQGVGDAGTAVRVEVELFPSVNLEGKSSSSASEVGIGWKKDY